eukprot:65540_1
MTTKKEEFNQNIVRSNEATDNLLCDQKFTKCISADNIKSVLEQYNKIITDKNQKSEYQVANTIDELINTKIWNGNYSNVKMLNDFFHLKYNHNINDSATQFNEFYKFLSDYDDTLSCDATNCKGYNRYYQKRCIITNTNDSKDNDDSINSIYSYNLICRIHTFFLHSYERSRLTKQEITYIEQQLLGVDHDQQQIDDKKLPLISKLLNNKKEKRNSVANKANHSKYVTSDHDSLNCIEISKILIDNGICIEVNQMQNAFDGFGYRKQQLINDLCVCIGNENDQNILLAHILTTELQCVESDTRQKIYDLIVHNYIKKNELNNDNFIRMLQYTVSELYPNVNLIKVAEIARKQKLSGKVFDKSTKDFKNSIKFGKLFQTVKNCNKKHWAKVYKTINKWQSKTYKTIENIETDEPESKNTEKCPEKRINYLDEDAIDEDILNLFCAITKADSWSAEPFLIESHWNIDDAINKYYALSGDATKLSAKYDNQKHDKLNEYQPMIYNEGIKFWYWKPRNEDDEKRYIESKYKNLKEEILATNQVSAQQWIDVQNECKILINTDKLQEIMSNGKHEDIYGIQNDASFTLPHLCAIKLYTDYTKLNGIFCAAFRLKKFGRNIYERIESLKNRNRRFAIWSKLLIECVQCYGYLGATNKAYYRGVDQEFMFKKFLARFYVPLSTTTAFETAAYYTHDSGLVIKLKKYNNLVSSFNCSMISSFDDEKETLFFGHDTILYINTVFDRKFNNFKKYITGIEEILNIANGTMNWNHANKINVFVDSILKTSNYKNMKLPSYIESLLNYHLLNLPNKIEYDLTKLINSYQWVKNVFIKEQGNFIPNISNLCNLFKNCGHILIKMPKSLPNWNINTFCKSVIKDTLHVFNKNMAIEFEWSSEHTARIVEIRFKQCALKLFQMELLTELKTTSVIIFPSYHESMLLLLDQSLEQKNSKPKKLKIEHHPKLLLLLYYWVRITISFIPHDIFLCICAYHGKYDDKSAYAYDDKSASIWICNISQSDYYLYNFEYGMIEKAVPTDYDVYVFGIQEGVSDDLLKDVSLYLNEFGVIKMKLQEAGSMFGVHATVSSVYTGIAIYYNYKKQAISKHIHLQSAISIPYGIMSRSKGAACVVLSILETNIAFLSIHISNATNFKELITKCNKKNVFVKCSHIICVGTFGSKVNATDLDVFTTSKILKFRSPIPEKSVLTTQTFQRLLYYTCSTVSKLTPQPHSNMLPENITYKSGYFHQYESKGNCIYCAIRLDVAKSVIFNKIKNNYKPDLIKLLIVGDTGVGKTLLLSRFVDDRFYEPEATIGVDIKGKKVDIDGKTVKLEIWDSAGIVNYRTIVSSYYRGVHGILLVYDITSQESFSHIRYHYMGQARMLASDSVTMMLIGNKCSKGAEREVTRQEGKNLANENGMAFLETCPKNDINVTEAFKTITNQVILRQMGEIKLDDYEKGKLNNAKVVKKKKFAFNFQ